MNQEKNQFFHTTDSLFASLMRYRKALFIISVSAAIISIIVSLVIPKKYKATTVIFTSLTNNASRSLIDPMYDSKDYVAFGDDKNCEQMMQIFKSADLMFAVAKKYHLYDRLKIVDAGDKDYELKGYYSDNFEYEITEYQSIKITIYDTHPELAFQYANGVIHLADSIYRDIVSQRLHATFNIIKQQYDSSKVVLKALEDSMDFYRKQGILSYDFQIKELTKGYADAELKGNEANIKLMQDKLNAFVQYGHGFMDIFAALNDQAKWMLQVKQAYLEAKTNMDKVITPFFVAEKPTIPDKATFPIRWLIVVVSVFAAFFFGLAFLLIYEKLSPKPPAFIQGTANQENTPQNP
ncbi:MAG TPA: hypothetical protein VK783_12140 [Bacteroidia bacterium]|jgi:hypothetical protein|nr:hypothetical protein [Bacteroidia bacterium]